MNVENYYYGYGDGFWVRRTYPPALPKWEGAESVMGLAPSLVGGVHEVYESCCIEALERSNTGMA